MPANEPIVGSCTDQVRPERLAVVPSVKRPVAVRWTGIPKGVEVGPVRVIDVSAAGLTLKLMLPAIRLLGSVAVT